LHTIKLQNKAAAALFKETLKNTADELQKVLAKITSSGRSFHHELSTIPVDHSKHTTMQQNVCKEVKSFSDAIHMAVDLEKYEAYVLHFIDSLKKKYGHHLVRNSKTDHKLVPADIHSILMQSDRYIPLDAFLLQKLLLLPLTLFAATARKSQPVPVDATMTHKYTTYLKHLKKKYKYDALDPFQAILHSKKRSR
jgi:hypothetical protein